MLTTAQQTVLQKYLVNGEQTWEEVCDRVCRFVAGAEKDERDREYWYNQFMNIMLPMKFIPGGSVLANANHGTRGMFNCFVLSSEDNIDTITQLVADSIRTTKFRGGIGINIGSQGQTGYIRPKGTPFKDGAALGPCAVLDMVSECSAKLTTGNKCFAKGTLLHTDLGYLPVEQVVSGTGVTVSTHRGHMPISSRFNNGTAEVWEVTTKKGYSVQVTPNHKIAVLDEYGDLVLKELQHLSVNDDLLLLLGTNAVTDYQKLSHVATCDKGQFAAQPNVLDERLAYLIGFSYGNGYVRRTPQDNYLQLSVSQEYPQVRDHLVNLTSELFCLKAHEHQGCGKVWNLKIHSTRLLTWLEANGLLKQKAANIDVPQQILQSPSSVIGAFLSGYFDADGCVRGGKGGYGMDSISKNFLSTIQLLLLGEGIISKLHYADRMAKGWSDIYRLNICGSEFKRRFQSLCAMSAKVQHFPMPLGRDSVGGYPIKLYKGSCYKGIVGTNSNCISYNTMLKLVEKTRDQGRTEKADSLATHLSYFPDKITSIEPKGETAIYDIEVEGVHLLSGNGVYTSNSRRGAFLFSMDWRHPDIWEFIQAKTQSKLDAATAKEIIQDLINTGDKETAADRLKSAWVETHLSPHGKRDRRWANANISVQIDKEFVQRLEDGDPSCQLLWRAIAQLAHDTADPGLLLIDNIRDRSPIGKYITCVNPCAEAPLPPNSSCNLGSLVLPKFIQGGEIDWNDLSHATEVATRFLDNVIDVSEFATPAQKHNIQNVYRQVGLGIIGWADILKEMQIPYDSQECLDAIDAWGSVIALAAYGASESLAEERGPCGIWPEIKDVRTGNPFERWYSNLAPGVAKTVLSGKQMRENPQPGFEQRPRRNSTILSIAPTGSIAQLAGHSWALEPDFGLAIWKQIYVDASKSEQNWVPMLHPCLEKLGLNESDRKTVLQTGSLAGTEFASQHPEKASVYRIAREVSPQWHLRVQQQWQRWIDQAASKTINMPAETTPEQIAEIYLAAARGGIKGVTVYRAGTLESEPVKVGSQEAQAELQAADQPEQPRECRSGKCEL